MDVREPRPPTFTVGFSAPALKRFRSFSIQEVCRSCDAVKAITVTLPDGPDFEQIRRRWEETVVDRGMCCQAKVLAP